MEKRADVYKQLDSDLANTLIEIAKKNYDDSKIELNYLCCALINYRKVSNESAVGSCPVKATLLSNSLFDLEIYPTKWISEFFRHS